jgi:HTH-type transcriptional regulator / antitoxin HigA
MSHIRHRDALSVDTALVGEDAVPSAVKSSIERRADKDAAEMLIPADALKSFIHRVAPLYSKDRIVQFAHRIKIHPGIIVGQLQHRGEIGFHSNRELLAKIRETVISVGIVDGWGHSTT